MAEGFRRFIPDIGSLDRQIRRKERSKRHQLKKLQDVPDNCVLRAGRLFKTSTVLNKLIENRDRRLKSVGWYVGSLGAMIKELKVHEFNSRRQRIPLKGKIFQAESLFSERMGMVNLQAQRIVFSRILDGRNIVVDATSYRDDPLA